MRTRNWTRSVRTSFLVVAASVLVLGGCSEPPIPPPTTGQVRTDGRGVEQAWVPPGHFIMGATDAAGVSGPDWAMRALPSEMPWHPVELTEGYWIDRYEVTNEAFASFVRAGGYDDSSLWSDEGWAWRTSQPDPLPKSCDEGRLKHPITCVTWFEAVAYAAWRGGRLPTNAEWEYAARGPGGDVYPWGNEWDATRANVVDSEETTPVGSYPDGVSWIGAYDMAGNVMEWVQDWFALDYYRDELMVDPAGPAEGERKIEKGGWWGSNPFVARASYNHFEDPRDYRDHHIGFRIVTEGL